MEHGQTDSIRITRATTTIVCISFDLKAETKHGQAQIIYIKYKNESFHFHLADERETREGEIERMFTS